MGAIGFTMFPRQHYRMVMLTQFSLGVGSAIHHARPDLPWSHAADIVAMICALGAALLLTLPAALIGVHYLRPASAALALTQLLVLLIQYASDQPQWRSGLMVAVGGLGFAYAMCIVRCSIQHKLYFAKGGAVRALTVHALAAVAVVAVAATSWIMERGECPTHMITKPAVHISFHAVYHLATAMALYGVTTMGAFVEERGNAQWRCYVFATVTHVSLRHSNAITTPYGVLAPQPDEIKPTTSNGQHRGSASASMGSQLCNLTVYNT